MPEEKQSSGPPQAKREPTIKSKGIAALVSFFLPGVGLVLCNPARTMEGVVVFLVAVVADVGIAILSFGGALIGGPAIGAILSAFSGGICCIATPIISMVSILGVLLMPLVHIAGAIHTYVRAM